MASPSDIVPLDNLIKKVDAIGQSSPPGEHYVAIKDGTDEIVSGSWYYLGIAKRHIYRIFTEKAGKPRVEGLSNTIHVKDPETEDTVNLVVSYTASCPDNHVEMLVKALGRHGSPDQELNRRITETAEAFLFGREREVFEDFERLKAELEARISVVITGDTGLKFRAVVQLANKQDLSPYHIKEVVEVRFVDSQRPQVISFECDLDVVRELTLRAIVTYGRLGALHASVTTAVTDFFRLQVNAEAYATEFARVDIFESLRRSLNDIAKKDGRRVNGLTVRAEKSNAGYMPPNFIERSYVAQVQPLGRAAPINLTSRMQLTRVDLAEFQRSSKQDIDTWLRETFDDTVRIVCFEKKYLEYLQPESWGRIEAEIKRVMSERAATVGYKVKQIFSLPELRENDFSELKHHRFDLTALALRSTARAHVDLTVAATFSIKDWNDEKLAEKINQGVDLHADIARSLHQALSAVLANVTPNDFILKFSEVNPPALSIESELQKSAFDKLEADYKAQISSAVVTQVDNDEIRRVREMLHVPKVLEFPVTPHAGPEDMKFSVTWRVCDIEPNSWDRISRPTCTLAAIEESLKNTLMATFSTIAPERLYVESTQAVKALADDAFPEPEREIRSLYGLGVSLSNLARKATPSEVNARTLLRQRQDAKVALFGQEIQKAVTAGQRQSDEELRSVQRVREWTDERFARLKMLSSLTKPNLEERDELKRLENEFNESMKREGGVTPGALPKIPDLYEGNDARTFKRIRHGRMMDDDMPDDDSSGDGKT